MMNSATPTSNDAAGVSAAANPGERSAGGIKPQGFGRRFGNASL